MNWNRLDDLSREQLYRVADCETILGYVESTGEYLLGIVVYEGNELIFITENKRVRNVTHVQFLDIPDDVEEVEQTCDWLEDLIKLKNNII